MPREIYHDDSSWERYPKYWNEKIETMPLKELKRLQEKKLRAQIEYVYSKSRFYHELFRKNNLYPSDIKTIEDLQKIPFTDKEDLRKSQEESPLGLHACVPLSNVIRIHASSGTTGRPTIVGLTRHDVEVFKDAVARFCYSAMVRPGDIVIHAMALTVFVGGLPFKDAIEEIGAVFVPIGTGPGTSERVVNFTKWLKANVIHCTPSFATYLGEYVKKRYNIEPRELGIRKIIGGAEPGFGIPSVRRAIEEEWQADAREGLGNADMLPIIFGECFYKTGMHFLVPDYVVVELIDPDTGENVEITEGATGELVYTAIDRECCPLIRFRTGDRVIVWTEQCECGRTGFRVRCIGRTDDMLKVSGVKVFPSAIKDIIASLRPKTTGALQILLTEPPPRVTPPLKIQVEYGEGVEDLATLKQEIEEELRAKLYISADVELVPPGTLPRYEMKAQLIKRLYEEKH